MKLQFAEGFPGDEASGAIGPFAYHHKRAEMPVEVEDTMGEALLRTTWRKRSETPVEGQVKPKVSYSDEPVFARVEEGPPPATQTEGATTEGAAGSQEAEFKLKRRGRFAEQV